MMNPRDHGTRCQRDSSEELRDALVDIVAATVLAIFASLSVQAAERAGEITNCTTGAGLGAYMSPTAGSFVTDRVAFGLCADSASS